MDEALRSAAMALLDPVRLRLIARLIEAPATAAELAAATGEPLPAVVRHLDRLVSAGLATAARTAGTQRYAFERGRLIEIAGALAALEPRDDDPTALGIGPDGTRLPAAEAKVLRSFFSDGRLTTIPAQPAKREVVLRYLRDRVFTEPRGYPEKEVNQRLALFHPDVAALRRYMVDGKLVTRSGGEYRRVEA
jgi:hypothetical protein